VGTFYRVWRDEIPARREESLKFIQSKREIRNVPPNAYPLLVTFTDINDPKSVLEVKPDNLAASFGVGYSLKSITLEITDEPVTEGKVEGVLGWLDKYYDKLLDGNRYSDAQNSNISNHLASGSFRTER
jgi:hypothetical protein